MLTEYSPGRFYCEMSRGGAAQPVCDRLAKLPVEELRHRAAEAEAEFYDRGITFTVYSDKDAIDRVLPFDAIPRILSAEEWSRIESGVCQRVAALNLLLQDLYHEQRILKDGVLPADLVLGNPHYRPMMQGLDLPHGTYVQVCGTDIVRDGRGAFLILEDNARTPSGVSYVVENRHMMMRAFPELLEGIGLRPVDNYGQKLLAALRETAPETEANPQAVLLSPGTFNSAYFEHAFLAREMGVPLVRGSDLTVEADDRVYMRTTRGLAQVAVIYRRIDDGFLDPAVFRPDSLLGVPGLMRAYRAGKVTLANAVGTGVADDKAIYAYMPRVIRYYLGQEPLLPNVETHICREPEALRYTLDHLAELVVKPVGESGGYGITIGPRASRQQLEECRRLLLADPANYISQPCLDLSVSPTLAGDGIEPRHVDLRPFAVTGAKTWVLPGGLTRVALQKDSLIVNSSQGGGSKDTWVLG
ncbi:circularly permuted type 2 ATP-grasp protein [Teichococcus vastitatis]|uniref:Circularly permuted type 2 ATP-grasp protein n=1 Tax=Teichococcus vastitatis TaxID=2307076 RepID=A0ABS9W958_9PROT|nr:circularly permuted type 2 ATP-grasp protein [Pseudoroseomonas vastitatis]MCI0755834.1 circularly permuted type 2 ATP-grasp protein [Pseudoroseomonas vastitatis]